MKKPYCVLAAVLALQGFAVGLTLATAAPLTYELDPAHTFPSLEFSHMGLSTWRGKFDRTRGTLVLDQAARTGTVDVTVETASINFGLDIMDTEARKPEFLSVEKFPDARYQGTVIFAGDKPARVEGTFTLRGVTVPLTLTLDHAVCLLHPYFKKPACGADARATVRWSAFGIPEFPGMSDEVQLRIQVEALVPDARP
jgi:polyisoprenoid-binding protein YceI